MTPKSEAEKWVRNHPRKSRDDLCPVKKKGKKAENRAQAQQQVKSLGKNKDSADSDVRNKARSLVPGKNWGQDRSGAKKRGNPGFGIKKKETLPNELKRKKSGKRPSKKTGPQRYSTQVKQKKSSGGQGERSRVGSKLVSSSVVGKKKK